MTLDEALMELAHARQQYHMLSNRAQTLIGQVDEVTCQLEGEAARNIALQQEVDTLRAALQELVERCDGEAGVREDGSNIDTMQAHAALGDLAQDFTPKEAQEILGMVNEGINLTDAFGQIYAARQGHTPGPWPEMLEALRNIAAVGHARDNVERANDKLDACIEWAREAIAKATNA